MPRASASAAWALASPSCNAWEICWAMRSMSRPGKGSVCAVEVPLGREDAASPAPRDRPAREEDVRRRGAVLVVEDDPDVRELLETLLIDEGWDTLTAADGRRALGLIASDAPQPDLVIAD